MKKYYLIVLCQVFSIISFEKEVNNEKYVDNNERPSVKEIKKKIAFYRKNNNIASVNSNNRYCSSTEDESEEIDVI